MPELIMDPIRQITPPPPVDPTPSIDRPAGLNYEHPGSRSLRRLLGLIVLIVVALVAVFFLIQRSMEKKKTVVPLVIPSHAPLASEATDNEKLTEPAIFVPTANAFIASPMVITGEVPPGWMFEGVFSVDLVTANHEMITSAQGKESKPGSWQSNRPIPFTATLEYTTTAQAGFIILRKDNPSGLPTNDGSFEYPVRFAH